MALTATLHPQRSGRLSAEGWSGRSYGLSAEGWSGRSYDGAPEEGAAVLKESLLANTCVARASARAAAHASASAPDGKGPLHERRRGSCSNLQSQLPSKQAFTFRAQNGRPRFIWVHVCVSLCHHRRRQQPSPLPAAQIPASFSSARPTRPMPAPRRPAPSPASWSGCPSHLLVYSWLAG